MNYHKGFSQTISASNRLYTNSKKKIRNEPETMGETFFPIGPVRNQNLIFPPLSKVYFLFIKYRYSEDQLFCSSVNLSH